MKTSSQLKPSMIATAINFVREMHSKHYRLMLESQSILLNLLHKLSLKNENDITKEDSRALIKANLSYMRAYNIFVYWDNQRHDLYNRFGGLK